MVTASRQSQPTTQIVNISAVGASQTLSSSSAPRTKKAENRGMASLGRAVTHAWSQVTETNPSDPGTQRLASSLLPALTRMCISAFFCILYMTLTSGMVKGHAGHNSEHIMQQPPTSFHDPNVVANKEHLKEHLKHEINVNKDMSPEEMEFHYFRLHDSNNDTFLDGQEIMKSLTHMMPPPELMPFEMQGKTAPDIAKLKKERYLQFMQGIVQVVDKVLETDDVDKDGYLSYPEYIVARRRDAKQMMKMQQEMLRQAEAYRQQQAELANKPKEALL